LKTIELFFKKEVRMEKKEIEVEVGVLGIVFKCPYCGEWNYMDINQLENKTKVLFTCNCGQELEIKLIWPERRL